MDCKQFRDNLSVYCAGDLDETNRSAAQSHLDRCLSCAKEYRRFNNLLHAMQDLDDPQPSESSRFEILQVLSPQVIQPAIPEILGVEDLLEYLGVTSEELDQEINNLPAFEFAGRLRFKKSHIDAWIEERRAARDSDIVLSRVKQWRARVV